MSRTEFRVRPCRNQERCTCNLRDGLPLETPFIGFCFEHPATIHNPIGTDFDTVFETVVDDRTFLTNIALLIDCESIPEECPYQTRTVSHPRQRVLNQVFFEVGWEFCMCNCDVHSNPPRLADFEKRKVRLQQRLVFFVPRLRIP